MKLVISMAVLNRLQMTKDCISMLLKNTTGEYELIVWDNGSRPDVKEFFDNLCMAENHKKYIRSDTNLGFIDPHNWIFEENKNRCDYFCVLNNDVVISEFGWNQRMIEALEGNDRLAQIGNLQKYGVLNDNLMGVPATHGSRLNPDYIEGSCFIVKTKIIKDNLPSLFDGKYLKFAYWEDGDLSLRLKSLGYEIAEMKVNVRHIGTQTLRNEPVPPDINTIMGENHEKFLDRWEIFVKQKRKMKILVKRAIAYGDVLLTEPILNELFYKYPDSEIYVDTQCSQMLEGSGLRLSKIEKGLGQDNKLFDKIIDLDLAYEKRPLLHIVDAYAQEAGVILDRKVPVYNPKIKWQENKDKVVLVNTDDSWKTREWDPQKWKYVLSKLKQEGYRIVEIGLRSYLGIGENALNVPFKDIAQMMSKASVYIGTDSMLMHLAQSIGLPVVIVFGCICPNYRITDWSKAKVLWLNQDELECAGCHHLKAAPNTSGPGCARDKIYCLENITPEMFLDTFFNRPFGEVTKPLRQGIGIVYDFDKPKPVPLPPIPTRQPTAESLKQSRAERDLLILIEANTIRQNPERFMAAKAIAGSHFVG